MKSFFRIAAAWCALAASPVLWADNAPEPLKGLVLWQDSAKSNPALSNAISLEFSYFLPCDAAVAQLPGGAVKYDWRKFDTLLADIASRGHQAIVRFRYAHPGEKLGGMKGATAVPGFIKKRRDYKETFAANPGGDGPTWYPDWSCKALEDFTLAFYAELARRYDADPRLAFLETGFGHWAEYHTSGTEIRPGKNFPSAEFQKRFFSLMEKSFKLTPWMVSIDSAMRERKGVSPAPDLARKGMAFGLFDDSFMCAGHDVAGGKGGWNEKDWRVFGPDHWKKAPHGGEISYFKKSDQKDFLSPVGIHGVKWKDAAAKYHVSFMIANDAPGGGYATPARFREASRECGYRLKLGRVRQERGALAVEVENRGVAPFYHEGTLAAGSRLAKGSVKGMLPGETRLFTIPGARKGDAIRLVSPKLLKPFPLDERCRH